MINLGKKEVTQLRDGWTIVTADRKPSAHYEHTIVVKNKERLNSLTFKYIEEKLKIIA